METILNNKAIDLTGLAIGIIVLGIVVSMGAIILVGVRDARLTDLDEVTTNNETTFINQTTDTLANTWGKSVDSCWGSYNQTGADIGNLPGGYNVSIPSGNYTATISDLNGQITLQNSTVTYYSNSSCSYTTFNTSRADWSLPDQAATGLLEYGNWFNILVIVGIAGVILALLFMAFGKGSGTSGGEGEVAY